VNPQNTPNFIRTGDGFECDAFFPPNTLDAETISARGITHSVSDVEMIRVRVTVDRCDVWAIAEFIGGGSFIRSNDNRSVASDCNAPVSRFVAVR
jgi:hypothetical protein